MSNLVGKLGSHRIEQLRALARDTKPDTIILEPLAVTLKLHDLWSRAWVAVTAEELTWLLDELEEMRDNK